jgi:hypothetical protein
MQGGTNGMKARSVSGVKKEACTTGTKHDIASFTLAPLKGRWGFAGVFCAVHMDMIAPHLLKCYLT